MAILKATVRFRNKSGLYPVYIRFTQVKQVSYVKTSWMVNDKGINERKEIIDPFVIKPKSSLENDKKLFLMTDWGIGDWHQLWVQFVATAVSVVYNVSVTYIIFKIVDKSVGVHVDKRVEEEGLDIYEHGYSAYSN